MAQFKTLMDVFKFLEKAIAGSAAKRHAWSLPLRYSTVIGR